MGGLPTNYWSTEARLGWLEEHLAAACTALERIEKSLAVVERAHTTRHIQAFRPLPGGHKLTQAEVEAFR